MSGPSLNDVVILCHTLHLKFPCIHRTHSFDSWINNKQTSTIKFFMMYTHCAHIFMHSLVGGFFHCIICKFHGHFEVRSKTLYILIYKRIFSMRCDDGIKYVLIWTRGVIMEWNSFTNIFWSENKTDFQKWNKP